MVIRDVIHGDIIIENQLVRNLIETPEFQRLRNVKQLGLTYLAFPTTEHSRYSHSLGVYHLAGKMIKIIEHKTKIQFDELDKLSLEIGCLLHDIGHGALSHTSEEFFGFDHEQYTLDIINDSNTKINKILKEVPNLIEKINLVIKKDFPNPILNSILSGTIDIDRMDYLLRDSYFAGVSYGEVDIDRIFNIIDVKNNQIVFHEKGIKALEDFIMSRYNMFSQVYLNKKALAYEKLVGEVLKELKDLVENNNQNLPASVNKIIPFFRENYVNVEEYLKLDDAVLITIINDLNDMPLTEETKTIKLLTKAFVEKKIIFKNNENVIYKNHTRKYQKSVYNEPVYIYTVNHEIKKLEDLSPLSHFIINNITISLPEIEFYIEDETN